MATEQLLDRAPLHAFAFPVDDAQLQHAALAAGFDVRLHRARHLPRSEGGQVESAGGGGPGFALHVPRLAGGSNAEGTAFVGGPSPQGSVGAARALRLTQGNADAASRVAARADPDERS